MVAEGDGADLLAILLKRALDGDRTAGNDLMVHVLMPAIDRAVRKRFRSVIAGRAEMEDIVQSVLLHLYDNDWARLRTFDPAKPLGPWVASVVRHWMMDLERKKLPEPKEDVQDELRSDGGPEDDAWMSESLERAAAQMREEDLILIRMHCFDEMSHAEIAQVFGISVAAASRRYQRAADRLKEILLSDTAPSPRKADEDLCDRAT